MRRLFIVGTSLFSSALFASNAPSEKAPKSSNLQGFYFGGFGGAGFVSITNTQTGVALTTPIKVNAKGSSENHTFGLGGLHFGYEWFKKSNRKVRLVPAVELETFYFAQTQKTYLDNPYSVFAGVDFHHFEDYFPLRNWAILANFVLALENKYITPYVAGGVGQQYIWIHDAYSNQMEPAEPGINHFNGNPQCA